MSQVLIDELLLAITMLLRKDAVQRRRLASAEEAGEQGDGKAHRGHG